MDEFQKELADARDDGNSQVIAVFEKHGWMTGQEWYDRFLKEVELLTDAVPEIVKETATKEQFALMVGKRLDEAAKKAAGLL